MKLGPVLSKANPPRNRKTPAARLPYSRSRAAKTDVPPVTANVYARSHQKSDPEILPEQSDQMAIPPTGGSIWVSLFLWSLVIPAFFSIGTWRLTPNRMFLLFAFIPLIGILLSGRCGRIRAVDVFLILYAAWNSISIFYHHGMAQLEFVGVGFIETVGGYLVGRCLIRTPGDFDHFVRVLFIIMLVMIPAAVLETFFGLRIYNEIVGLFTDTFAWAEFVRLGVYRAQVVFEHPILFGVFTSSTFSFLYLMINRDTGKSSGMRRGWASIVPTMLSLSSGAYLLLMIQFGLVAWKRIFQSMVNRWRILTGLVVSGYVAIDLLSNRTPFEVFASYMTFDAGTSYWRILIFRYGMQNVWANPVFGIGLKYWVRPSWMGTPSIDNFWLLTTMRYGIPALVFLLAGLLSLVFALVFRKIYSQYVGQQRLALVFVLLSIFVAIATVHLWNATYIYMMFLFGCGVWMLDYEDDGKSAGRGQSAPTRKASPRSRNQSN